jgi:hypothetical protein
LAAEAGGISNTDVSFTVQAKSVCRNDAGLDFVLPVDEAAVSTNYNYDIKTPANTLSFTGDELIYALTYPKCPVTCVVEEDITP